jgi:UDP-N-acetylglucosamine 3-dehydrogenase
MMRIGVVGAGTIGRVRIRSVRDDPATELVAVYDVAQSAATAAAAGTQARVCTDLTAFLDTPMDAVIVSTPPHLHEEACVGAFARGRHVLCEKPLSNTVEAGRRIVDAALAADRVLAVGFNLRYYPMIKYLKQVLDEGRIGKVDHLRVFGGHDGLHNFRADWQYKMPESGGGAMMDIGIHMTDLARYVMGEITSVYGCMSESVWRVPGSEDNAVAIFRSPDGLPATYHATWSEWRGYRTYVEVYGTEGMVRGAYAPMQNLLITQAGPKAPRHRTRRFYPEIMVREKLKSWQATLLISFQEELRDFQRMVAGDAKVPLADGYAGLRSLEVAAAVRESSRTNEVVKLPALGRMRG